MINFWHTFLGDQIVGESTVVDVLAFEPARSHSDVHADVAAKSGKNIGGPHIGKEADFGFRHCQHGALCGDAEGSEDTDPDTTAHDDAVPVGDLQ